MVVFVCRNGCEILAHVFFFCVRFDISRSLFIEKPFCRDSSPREQNQSAVLPSVPFSDRLCNVVNDFSVHHWPAWRSFAASTDLTFIYASRIAYRWIVSFRTSFASIFSFSEFYFTRSRMAIICKYVQIPDIPSCFFFFLPRQTDFNLKTCFWVCVCHKNAFSTSFTVCSTLFLIRDLLKKSLFIYLFTRLQVGVVC